MNMNISDKLIHEIDSVSGLLYRAIISYTIFFTGMVFFLGSEKLNSLNINIYFVLNLLTIVILTWFIRRSFKIQLHERNLITFRIALFLLLNSTMITLVGGLKVIDSDITSLFSALLYVPAMILIIYSFNSFISYVNMRYKSVVDLSLTDELTGLPNRRYLNVKLRELEDKSGAICIIDIDNFKTINDNYGHEMGDKVLKNTGLMLKKISCENIFVSRSGGEEFAIVIREGSAINILAERIKQSLSLSTANGIPTTVSIGVALKTVNQTSSSCLAAADAALYKSKRNGKNRITYSMAHNE
ncbi:GGDEF domain-containing protein [Erwinia sp. JH02]|uniref:GGDEF domain-containing protein n=1 Tax=Erwinia sp. JH02 TaxID=2733394 RepID=UPI001489F102|nr:GGDEF domain-containing protein [Erwinia sp. JH02]NNS10198.1 GGDEF domain-containing protein [Erwinia sp. JH02]